MADKTPKSVLKMQLCHLIRTKQDLKCRIQKCYCLLRQQDNVGLFGEQDNGSNPSIQQENMDIDAEHILKTRKYIMRLELEHGHVSKSIQNLMEKLAKDGRSSASSSRNSGFTERSSNVSTKCSCHSTKSNRSGPSRRPLRNKDSSSENSDSNLCSWETCHPPKRVEIIAVIVRVFPNSPGRKAGLRPGDFIIEFGKINANNYSGDPASLVEYAEYREKQPIRVKIFRAGKMTTKKLIPKEWAGCGLLGFRFGNVFK